MNQVSQSYRPTLDASVACLSRQGRQSKHHARHRWTRDFADAVNPLSLRTPYFLHCSYGDSLLVLKALCVPFLLTTKIVTPGQTPVRRSGPRIIRGQGRGNGGGIPPRTSKKVLPPRPKFLFTTVPPLAAAGGQKKILNKIKKKCEFFGETIKKMAAKGG